jgi:transcriptional regulator with XRE-family HTH domain
MDKIEKIKKNIGDNIKKIRLSSNKEVKAVSFDLGISPAAYRNIERGLTDISISRIIQISDYFNVDFTEILAIENASTFYFTPNNNSTGTQNNHQIGHQQGDAYSIAFDFIQKENEFLKEQNQSLIKMMANK